MNGHTYFIWMLMDRHIYFRRMPVDGQTYFLWVSTNRPIYFPWMSRDGHTDFPQRDEKNNDQRGPSIRPTLETVSKAMLGRGNVGQRQCWQCWAEATLGRGNVGQRQCWAEATLGRGNVGQRQCWAEATLGRGNVGQRQRWAEGNVGQCQAEATLGETSERRDGAHTGERDFVAVSKSPRFLSMQNDHRND